jgi:hypothetical protein
MAGLSMTLEELAIELPEARFGRGILVDRTPAERNRAGMIWSDYETAKRECRDPAHVARAVAIERAHTDMLFRLWRA